MPPPTAASSRERRKGDTARLTERAHAALRTYRPDVWAVYTRCVLQGMSQVAGSQDLAAQQPTVSLWVRRGQKLIAAYMAGDWQPDEGIFPNSCPNCGEGFDKRKPRERFCPTCREEHHCAQ